LWLARLVPCLLLKGFTVREHKIEVLLQPLLVRRLELGTDVQASLRHEVARKREVTQSTALRRKVERRDPVAEGPTRTPPALGMGVIAVYEKVAYEAGCDALLRGQERSFVDASDQFDALLDVDIGVYTCP
jgi:hypothetical protein